MKHPLLLLVLLFSLTPILLSAQFSGLEKVVQYHFEEGLEDYSTTKIYARSVHETDKLIAIFGGGLDHEVSVFGSSGQIFNHDLLGPTSLSFSEFDISIDALAEFDSYLTIGADASSASGFINEIHINGTLEFTDFENGNGNLVIGTDSQYSSIAVPETSDQALLGEDKRILIAQITTIGEIQGAINLKFKTAEGYQLVEQIDLAGEYGCTHPLALNYDPEATYLDESCEFQNSGCTDPEAINYSPEAETDDGSCEYAGCTDELALNYDPNANTDDGSCIASCEELNLSISFSNSTNNGVLTLCDSDGDGLFLFEAEYEVLGESVNGVFIDWGDGTEEEFNSDQQEAIHEYSSSDSYEVELILRADFNCTAQANYHVQTVAKPTASINYVGESEICVGEEIQFELSNWENNVSDTEYRLESSDGSIEVEMNHPPQITHSHSFSIPSCDQSAFDGTPFSYGIRLIAENECGSSEMNLPALRVNGSSTAVMTEFSISDADAVICPSENLTVSNTSFGHQQTTDEGCISTQPGNWNISPTDGWEIISGDLNSPDGFEVKFNDPDSYLIELTDNTLCGVEASTESILTQEPIGQITGTVTLNDEPSEGMTVVAYSWHEANGEFFMAASAVTDENGNYLFDLEEGNYQVKSIPGESIDAPPFYTNGVYNWMEAEILEVSCQSLENTTISMQDFSEEGLDISINGSVFYRSQLKSLQGDPIPGIPIIIEKDTTESVALTATVTNESGMYSFESLPQGEYRMLVDIPGLPMAETHYFSIGANSEPLLDLNFYADSLDQIYINDLVNVTHVIDSDLPKIIAYPNPTKGIIHISKDTFEMSPWEIDLFDINGRSIMLETVQTKSGWELDLSALNSGVYFLEFRSSEFRDTIKILKE